MAALRVLDIKEGTIVDGPGLRTAIYFAGCDHHCPGCHNPQSWDFAAGNEMTVDQIMDVVVENGFDVTFTGGDPMYIAAQLIDLARRIKDAGMTLWCYTGFTFEQLQSNKDACRLLEYVDVLVDGSYIEAERDISLHFRGSRNQRIINLHPGANSIADPGYED